MTIGYDGLPPSYIGLGAPLTPNLGLSLAGMDPSVAENFWLIDVFAAGGGGTSVFVNSASVANPNFNDTTPAAPLGFTNILWQVTGSNVSAYAANGVPAGNTGDIQFNNAGAFDATDNFTWDVTGEFGLAVVGHQNGGFFLTDNLGANTQLLGVGVELDASGTVLATATVIDVFSLITGAVNNVKGLRVATTISGTTNQYIGIDVIGPAAGHATQVLGIRLINVSNGGDVTSRALEVADGNIEFASGTALLAGNSFVDPTDQTRGFLLNFGTVSSGSIWNVNIPDADSSTAEEAAVTSNHALNGFNVTNGNFSYIPIAQTATVISGQALVSYDATTGLFSQAVNTTLWSDLQNAAGALTLANGTNATTFNQTSAVNWTWANTTSATSTVAQSSPIFNINGTYWTGSASAADSWTIQDAVTNGTLGVSALTFGHTGSTGNAYLSIPQLLSTSSGIASMTQTAADNCTRADENPMTDGGSWTAGFATFAGLTVNAGRLVSNLWQPTVVANFAYVLWTADGTAFDSQNQWSEITVQALTSNSKSCAAIVRGSTSAGNGYRIVVVGPVTGTGQVWLDKYVANTATYIGTGLSRTITAGDKFRVAVQDLPGGGVLILGYQNGIQILSAIDSTSVIATGLPGMQVYAGNAGATTNAEISAWSGGTIAANNGHIQLVSSGAATSTQSVNSSVFGIGGQYWTGSATALDEWFFQTQIANGTNGASNLVLTHSGSSGTIAFALASSTFASSSTSINSPSFAINGSYYTGSFGATDSWALQNVVANGTNGASTLTLSHSGTAGRITLQLPALTFLQWGTGINGPGSPGNVAAGFALTSGVQNGSISLYVSNGSNAIFQLFQGGTSQYNFTSVGFTCGQPITSYAGTATVGQGVPSEIGTLVDLTAQGAAITATNIIASAPRTGMYRISWSATITTAATTGAATSVLGGTNGFQIGFTSPTDSVAKTVVPGNSTTSAANTTGTAVAGSYAVYAKTGTAITYAFDYASNTAGEMKYELHVRLEAM